MVQFIIDLLLVSFIILGNSIGVLLVSSITVASFIVFCHRFEYPFYYFHILQSADDEPHPPSPTSTAASSPDALREVHSTTSNEFPRASSSTFVPLQTEKPSVAEPSCQSESPDDTVSSVSNVTTDSHSKELLQDLSSMLRLVGRKIFTFGQIIIFFS